MKRIEIFNAKDEQLMPITDTSAVYDGEKNRLDTILIKKIEADDTDVSTNIEDPDPINIHTRALMSELLINIRGYTISIDDWIKSNDIYCAEITDLHIKDTSVVNIYMDANNSKIANSAGLYSYTESYDGKIIIYSENIPTENIVCDYTIQTPVESVSGGAILSGSTIARLDTEITNLQNQLDTEIANLKSQLANMIIVKQNVIISVDSWILLEGEYYYADIKDEDVSSNSIINLTIQEDSLEVADSAQLHSNVDSYQNYIRVYSENIPTEDIVCTYRITNPYVS